MRFMWETPLFSPCRIRDDAGGGGGGEPAVVGHRQAQNALKLHLEDNNKEKRLMANKMRGNEGSFQEKK